MACACALVLSLAMRVLGLEVVFIFCILAAAPLVAVAMDGVFCSFAGVVLRSWAGGAAQARPSSSAALRPAIGVGTLGRMAVN